MTFYRRDLPHLQRDDKPHFITFATHHRMVLSASARDIVLQSCLRDNGSRYDLFAAVVMPEHVHLILIPLIDHAQEEVVSLIEIMKAIKGASAHLINRQLNRRGTVWQEESFDHVLRSSEKLDAAVKYIAQNPVRRGLVVGCQSYRWLWCK